jgi:heme exporter protein C
MALVNAFDDPERGEKSASLLAIVGAVNVPIIKFSVDWWNTLHQPASVVRLDGPAIHPDMLWPLLIMIFAFKMFFVFTLIIRIKAEITAARLRNVQISLQGN